MKVGIHKARYGKFPIFLQRYESILNFNGIEHVRLDASNSNFWENVSNLDLFIYRWLHYHDEHQISRAIMPVIEKEMSIKCFPDLATSWHYDDKIKQFFLLKQHDFPVINSRVFWSRDAAYEWLENHAEFPTVFKLKGGASSSNVILINNIKQAKRIVRTMFAKGAKSGRLPTTSSTRWKDFNLSKEIHRWGGNVLRTLRGEDIYPYWQIDKNYAYFQEFLPKNDFDTRVTIIGDRAFAFRRMNRANDFRSSGSGIISYDIDKIDLRTIEIAFQISNTIGFQSMAYDFLTDSGGNFKVCEMSYDYVDSAVYHCTGHWDSKLNWHEGHLLPQFCQLSDALELPDLKHPVIDCPLPVTLKVI